MYYSPPDFEEINFCCEQCKVFFQYGIVMKIRQNCETVRLEFGIFPSQVAGSQVAAKNIVKGKMAKLLKL